MNKKDFYSAVATGLTAGVILWRILIYLEHAVVFGISSAALIILTPVLWVIGVWLGYFLGQWLSFFKQFGKFAAIGITNASVDFGILYLLIGISGLGQTGFYYSVFKSISFIVALIHSYFWNKFWTFEAHSSGDKRTEFFKFVGVTVFTFLFNVSVASIVVNLVHPAFGISTAGWAGVGAALGAFSGLAINFVGLRFVVFKK